jgi:hypothetical protein
MQKVQRKILDWYRYLIFCGLYNRVGDREGGGGHFTAAIQTIDSVLRSVPDLYAVSRIRIRNYLYGSGSFHQQAKNLD